MLHSGSRGVGNRIGSYFIELARKDMRRLQRNLPDKDLAYFPEGTKYFNDYVEAVEWAQEFARREPSDHDGQRDLRGAAFRRSASVHGASCRRSTATTTTSQGAALRRRSQHHPQRSGARRQRATWELFPEAWARDRTSFADWAIRRALKAAAMERDGACPVERRNVDSRWRIMPE